MNNTFFSCFKNIFITFLIFFCGIFIYAADSSVTRPDTDIPAHTHITDAQFAYEQKDFNRAFQELYVAKEKRKNESDWAVHTLETALRQPSVLNLETDDINTLLRFFIQRRNTDVVRIIETVLLKYSVEEFNFSVQNIVEYLKQATEFPEADYLLGKLYMAEGEPDIADAFFIKAYESRLFLDIPDMQYDILYSLAELYNLQNKSDTYEEVLLLIASEDENYYMQGSPSTFLNAVTNAVKNNMETDKFFLLYRNDFYKTLNAWYYLTKYFYDLNHTEKAFETAILFAVVSFTRIDEVLKNYDMHYEYEGLQYLFQKLKTFPDIATWATKHNMWEGFYLLAELCRQQGFNDFANELYSALATECPERTWKILAQKALEI
ncbi:MAG: hypothetical protein R3Y36_01425 [Spirochaetales bacterium]